MTTPLSPEPAPVRAELIECLTVMADNIEIAGRRGLAELIREAIATLSDDAKDKQIAALTAERDEALKSVEDAESEAYQEGYDEGKSEWRGVKAQLWNAMVHWLELRHGMEPDGDGYTVDNLLGGLSEVEAESKRVGNLLTKAIARAEALEAELARLNAGTEDGGAPADAKTLRTLVAFVMQMSRYLPEGNEWRRKSHDYLKRKGLLPSPLRNTTRST